MPVPHTIRAGTSLGIQKAGSLPAKIGSALQPFCYIDAVRDKGGCFKGSPHDHHDIAQKD